MYLTVNEITTKKIKDLPTILQVSIIKAICETIRYTFTDSFYNTIRECTINEADIYVPDLYKKYIHILA